MRHISIGQIKGKWTDEADVVVAADAGAPTDPTALSASAIAEGYDLTWDRSTALDYAYTSVYDAADGTAFSAATLRGTTNGSHFARVGLGEDPLTVWIRHVDRSGNISG